MNSRSAFALLALWLTFLLACQAIRCDAEEVLYEQRLRAQPGKIIVPVRIDGATFPMIFDSGCYTPAFDLSMQSHVGRSVGKTTLNVFGGAVGTRLYQAPGMVVGAWTLAPSEAVVMDFARFSAMLGVKVRGVLGTRCLQQAAIDLDFDRERLRLLRRYQPPESAAPFSPGEKSGGWQYLPVKFNEAGPSVTTRLEDLTVHFIVDTGTNASVGLRRSTFDKLAARGVIVREPETEADIRQGANGPFKIRTGRFTRGNLFGIDLNNTPVEDDGDVDVLGMVFLLRLNSVLDLAGKRFYFERRNAGPPLRPAIMLGAAFTYPAGQCHVAAVRRGGGPAEQAGVRLDDIILKLGPLEGKALNDSAVYDLCETHAGQAIEVQLARPGTPRIIQTRLQLLKKQFVYLPTP